MQIAAPGFSQQSIDLIDSFFIYALTAQFSHLGWTHLALNLAGLAVVTWGFASICSPVKMASTLLGGLFWVAAYVSWIEPLAWYCGLSGALHALFTACLILALHQRGGTPGWPLCLLALGLILKLILEAMGGAQGTDPLIGGPIAFAAHRGGALGGLLMGLLLVAVGTQQGKHRQQTQ